MQTVKLYGYATSPYVRKTACFLYFKGVSFEHVPVNPINAEATIGHTGDNQVPVLEIDGEWRKESSDHALWLDEIFPDNPLCPVAGREKIETIDQWISDTFLTALFRPAIDSELNLQFRYRGWRLAAIVSAHTPLSEKVRHSWPELLKQAPFIQQMANHTDLTETFKDMQLRIFSELLDHLGEGPYLGEMAQPTMLDLAVFPQLVFGYLYGLEEHLMAAMDPRAKAWLKRVSKHLPANPTLAVDFLQINDLADVLG